METQDKITTFTLVVDDFQVCYFSKEDANHFLLNALTNKYPTKINWKGEKYIGIDSEWDYTKGKVILSMKGYVKKKQSKNLKLVVTTITKQCMDQDYTHHHHMEKRYNRNQKISPQN